MDARFRDIARYPALGAVVFGRFVTVMLRDGGDGAPALFDADELEDVREGDADLYARLLRMFVEESAGRIAVLREALGVADWQRAREASHSIKGSSASIGAVRMSARAKVVEIHSRAEDPAAHDELGRLEQAYEATRELLESASRPPA